MRAILSAGVTPARQFVNAERSRRRAHRRLAIAGQDFDRDVAASERGDRRRCIRAQALPNREDVRVSPWRKATTRRLGIACTGCRWRVWSAPQNDGLPKPDLEPVDQATHALARDLLDPGQRRPSLRGPRDRGGDRMTAGQRKPPGELEHVLGISAALATSSSGKVSVPVLSKTT